MSDEQHPESDVESQQRRLDELIAQVAANRGDIDALQVRADEAQRRGGRE